MALPSRTVFFRDFGTFSRVKFTKSQCDMDQHISGKGTAIKHKSEKPNADLKIFVKFEEHSHNRFSWFALSAVSFGSLGLLTLGVLCGIYCL